MALPHERCAPGEVCCTSLFDVACTIRDVAIAAVEGCSVVDCDLPGLASYVSMGQQIADPEADFLVVSMTSIGPAPSSADRTGNMIQPLFRATFQVKLLETGWPQPYGDGEEILVPSPVLVENVTRHSMAHGEAMYRALGNALTSRMLTPDPSCFQRIEPLQPIEPSGGTTGWITYITVDAFQ